MTADSNNPTTNRAAFEAAITNVLTSARAAGFARGRGLDDTADDRAEDAAVAALMALYDQAAQAPAREADGVADGRALLSDVWDAYAAGARSGQHHPDATEVDIQRSCDAYVKSLGLGPSEAQCILKVKQLKYQGSWHNGKPYLILPDDWSIGTRVRITRLPEPTNG